jgi:hypothetical protein
MTDELRNHLATIQPGPIIDPADLECLLAGCWDEFTGDDGGMEGHKLLGRMEAVSWEPPGLVFKSERHGRRDLEAPRPAWSHPHAHRNLPRMRHASRFAFQSGKASCGVRRARKLSRRQRSRDKERNPSRVTRAKKGMGKRTLRDWGT